MLKKYLVVLGCSGKLQFYLTLYSSCMWNNVSVWGYRQRASNIYMNAFCAVKFVMTWNSIVFFFSLPLCVWWIDYLLYVFEVKIPASMVTVLPSCMWVLVIVCASLGDAVTRRMLFFFQPVLQSHRRRPLVRVYDAIIKGWGCPFFCYCVSSEMQTLQRIFLWAVNV